MVIGTASRPQPRRRGSRQLDVLRALVRVAFPWPLVAMLGRMRAWQQPSKSALPADLAYVLRAAGQAIVHRSTDSAVQAHAARSRPVRLRPIPRLALRPQRQHEHDLERFGIAVQRYIAA